MFTWFYLFWIWKKKPQQTTPTLLIKAVYPGLSVSYYEVCCYVQLVLLKTEIKIPIWDRSEGTLGNITGFLANYRTSLNNRSGRIKSFKSIQVDDLVLWSFVFCYLHACATVWFWNCCTILGTGEDKPAMMASGGGCVCLLCAVFL